MAWIRWQGLAAFIIVIALCLGLVRLALPFSLKFAIESIGSRMVGAAVEVDDVDILMFPAGVRLQQFSVADPDAPMQNMFSFEEAEASIDPVKAYLGKTIIEELSISGLQFGSARSHSGALKKRVKKPEAEGFAGIDFKNMIGGVLPDLPSVDDILSREPLLTEQRKKEWDALYSEQKQKLKAARKALIDKDDIERYKEEIDAISSGKIESAADFVSRAKKLEEIKDRLKQDRDNIVAAKNQYQESFALLSDQLKRLKNAPAEDWQRIKEKYSLDSMGAANVSGLLFGQRVADIGKKGLEVYQLAKPILAAGAEKEVVARAEGRFVDFPTEHPLPDFLIRDLSFSARLAQGKVRGEVRNLTHQSRVLGEPIDFSIGGKQMAKMESLDVKGRIDTRDEDALAIGILFDIANYTIMDMALSQDHDFPLTLKAARLSVKGGLKTNADNVVFNALADFSDADFVSGADNGMAKYIGQTLEKIKRFNVQIGADGKFRAPDIHMQSDLDARLKDAAKEIFADKRKVLESKLRERLAEKLGEALPDQEGELQGILAEANSLDEGLNSIEDLLKRELDSYKEEQKKKLTKKLFDKLKKD